MSAATLSVHLELDGDDYTNMALLNVIYELDLCLNTLKEDGQIRAFEVVRT